MAHTNYKKLYSLDLYLEGDHVHYGPDALKVTPEPVIRLLLRESWKQAKQAQRKKMCVIIGADGKPQRCKEKCSKCPYIKGEDGEKMGQPQGSDLSLEGLEKDHVYPSCKGPSIEEAYEQKERIEEACKAIQSLKPIDKHIYYLYLLGYKEREISAIVHKSQPTVHHHIKKVKEILKKVDKDR